MKLSDLYPILTLIIGVAGIIMGFFGRIMTLRNRRIENIEKKVEPLPGMQQDIENIKEWLGRQDERFEKIIDLMLQKPRN